MYLQKKSKNIKIQIINSLNDESGYKELMYWRKDWVIHDWFCDNFEVENCKHIKIEKEGLLELIKYLEDNIDGSGWKEDIKKLSEIVEKTDWDNEEIYYYAWW